MKKIIITALLLAAAGAGHAQDEAAPFLSITVDPRAAAMGSVSTTLASDAYAVFSGSAAGAFAADKFAISASFAPVSSADRNLITGAGYVTFGKAGTLTAGFRYYGGKSIQGYDDGGNLTDTFKPADMAAEAGYALKLHKNWSIGLTARFINSSIWTDMSASAFAADLQAMFRTEVGSNKSDLRVSAGLRNLGTKLSYDESSAAMPGAAGVNAAMSIPLDSKKVHVVSWTAGADLKITGDTGLRAGVGAEYFAFDIVGVRAGYHIESDSRKFDTGKGNNLSYATVGLGLKYKFVRADFTYLLGGSESPVKGTWMAGIGVMF